MSLSAVEYHNGIYLKRNDLNEFCGCFGGKAECAFDFISRARTKEFVTCGSRDSLQCDIVSKMCERLGYECHVFMPLGKTTPTMERISKRKKTVLRKVDKGYTSVIKARAREFADIQNMTYIPFGMEHTNSVNIIAKQVENIPEEVKRIVVPVGGGVTLCGVLKGLHDFNRRDVKVLGVMTGKRPDKLLKSFYTDISYTLVPYREGVSPLAMYSMKTDYSIGAVKLDPIYEGKCYEFLTSGDLLWVVGYHEVN